ncbi:MAG: AAA family ATPase [Candidatus Bipolaricaulota bacterium]
MQDHPKAILVAGPNGAGKTTFVRQYLETHPGLEYLSADVLAFELSPGRPERAYVTAGKVYFRRLKDLLHARSSFVTEVTLASARFARHVERFQEAGYGVELIFIHLDSPELCVARVAERVRKGGHAVGRDDIVRRYGRSVSNFWTKYRYGVDGWFLMQNSSESFTLVAFGSPTSLTVEEVGLYDSFLRGVGHDAC